MSIVCVIAISRSFHLLVRKDVKTGLSVQRIVQPALFKSNGTLMLPQAQEEVLTMHPQGCEECILKTPQATPAQPVSEDSGDVSFVSLGCVFGQLSAQWHIRGLRGLLFDLHPFTRLCIVLQRV